MPSRPKPSGASSLCCWPILPLPLIRAYPVYTVVAEKLEAMVSLGAQNTRMKDFFDVLFILRTEVLDQAMLIKAVQNTFDRRKTPSSHREASNCLLPSFGASKEAMWQAFLNRNGIKGKTETFRGSLSTKSPPGFPFDWVHAS